VCPGDPHLFWSAAEDGVVRQFDTRLANQKSYTSPNALVHLPGSSSSSSRGGSGRTEIKGLDICQANPHLLALACGDPYVRIYDRRRLSPTTVSAAVRARPLMQLTPPHLPVGTSLVVLGVTCNLSCNLKTSLWAHAISALLLWGNLVLLRENL
jgi:WD and tetratricopeptide repeat-containing protein 1